MLNELGVRKRLVLGITLLFIFSLVVSCFGFSMIFPGKNAEFKEKIKSQEHRKITVEGQIFDRKQNPLTVPESPGVIAPIVNPHEFSLLLGYTTPFTSCGLRSRYDSFLYPSNKERGADIILTIDDEVQYGIYELLKGRDAAVVVLDNKTGQVIAFVSNDPHIDVDYNNISATVTAATSYEGSLLPNTSNYAAPGSVWKIASSVAVIEAGLQNDVFYDSGTAKIGGFEFRNSGKAAHGNITLREAIVYSDNVYFSTVCTKLGSKTLSDVYERLGVGQNIDLDFMTLKARHNLGGSGLVNTAATSIGQGKLEICPVNMAMLAQAISNEGIIMKPYMISSISDRETKKVIRSGKPEKFGVLCSSETADYIKDSMAKAAKSYGLPDGIYAKSGTAQVGNCYRASLMTFNENFTVVVTQDNTYISGPSLAPLVENIYGVLSGMVI